MHLALHRAWQVTALEFPMSTTTEVSQGPILKVISSQCDPAAFYALLNSSNTGNPEDTKFLVTIDPIDSEGWDLDGTDLESSIILYNFGITHTCLGSVSGTYCDDVKLQDSFYGILQLTHTLAFKLFRKALYKSHLCTCIMLINILVMVNLVQICSRNDPDASEDYCGSLEELLLLVHAHQKLVPVLDYKFAPAA